MRLGVILRLGSSVLITAITDSGGFFIFLATGDALPVCKRMLSWFAKNVTSGLH